MDRHRLRENAKDIAFELVEVHHATVGRIRNPKHVGSVRHCKDGRLMVGYSVLPCILTTAERLGRLLGVG